MTLIHHTSVVMFEFLFHVYQERADIPNKSKKLGEGREQTKKNAVEFIIYVSLHNIYYATCLKHMSFRYN